MIRRFINKAIWLFVKKIPWKPILIWGPWMVILLAVGFYGIENWRGARAWEKARLSANKEGISLNLQDYFPEPHPDGFDPTQLPILDGEKTQSFKLKISKGYSGLNSGSAGRDAIRTTNRWKAESRDIRLWLDPANGPYTHEEAAIELQRIGQLELDRLRLLVEHSKGQKLIFRPTSATPTFKELSQANLISLLRAHQIAGEDTLIALAVGNDEQTLDNLRLMSSLIQSESYSTLLSFLLNHTGLISFEHVTWEAIVGDHLSREQLKELEVMFAQIDITRQLSEMLIAELLFSLTALENSKSNKDELAQTILGVTKFGLFTKIKTGWSPADQLFWKIDKFILKRIPSGWIDLCKAEILLQTLSMHRKFKKEGFEGIAAHDIQTSTTHFLGNIYAQEVLSMYQKSAAKASYTEALIRIARIGIALEIWRKNNGEYPESLSKFTTLPLEDPFSGKAFGYRLKADQTPIVWSVGRNRIDENGIPGFTKEEGDIVWQLTPIPDLTEADLKKKLRKHRVKRELF